jgi:uncharacterized membrane-anchored protein
MLRQSCVRAFMRREHMQRSTSGNLYLIGLPIVMIGLIPFMVAYLGVIQNLSIVALLLAGVLLLLVGGILMCIGYLGALAKLAQLSQWGWFVLLLLFSVITMFVYIFAGPTESNVAKE